jgi:uncharacterized protein (DUF305 family)
METRALLFGIIGFLLGGLVVSIAATQLDDDAPADGSMTMTEMSKSLTDKSGDDFDAAFITAMVDHHQGAIDMAELAGSRAEHDEIKQLSQAIIRAQEGEIAQMHDWQREWGYYDSMDMGSAPLRR